MSRSQLRTRRTTQTARIEPSNDARAMKQTIRSNDQVLRAILEETVESAQQDGIKESGRTFCPQSMQSVLGPHERFPRAVRLRSCPVGSGAIVHTHVTHGELLDPEHSLPDMANVLYTDLDASYVLGVESSDVLLSPRSPEAAQRRFERALGVTIDEPSDLVDALKSGDIPDPPSARRDVRTELAPLFESESIRFPQMRQEIDRLRNEGVIAPAPIGTGPLFGCGSYTHYGYDPAQHVHRQPASGLRESLANEADRIANPVIDIGPRQEGDVPIDTQTVKAEVAGTVVGIVIGGTINWIYFGGRTG